MRVLSIDPSHSGPYVLLRNFDYYGKEMCCGRCWAIATIISRTVNAIDVAVKKADAGSGIAVLAVVLASSARLVNDCIGREKLDRIMVHVDERLTARLH